MRELKQDNICSFVGAYTDQSTITLVTEYCRRGSLEDVLEDGDIKLDELFISSLVNDLIRGMAFIHSNFGVHGNLKSTNCVITGRWVLQLTDFGLADLRNSELRRRSVEMLDEDNNQMDQTILKAQLWRSPELLRQGPDNMVVTKEADVYAFGIILHEIIARKGPFSTSSENALEVNGKFTKY